QFWQEVDSRVSIPDMSTLSERMAWVLELNGDSARSLSLRAGLSQSHVGQIKRGDVGKRTSPEVLMKIAEAANVDYTWLSTGEGLPRPEFVSRPVEPGRRGGRKSEPARDVRRPAGPVRTVEDLSDLEESLEQIDRAVIKLDLDAGGEGYVR